VIGEIAQVDTLTRRNSETVCASSGEVCIFLDESGNTGVDLLNVDQPVFALASTRLDRATAEAMLKPLTKGGLREAKYSKLRGTRPGQQALVEFFSSPALSLETSRFKLIDKKYYLVSHFVDKLIEPPLHEAGLDLYERDAHVGLTNIWYHAGRTIFPGALWDDVLRSFLAAIRRCDLPSFRAFDAVLARAAPHVPEESQDFATGVLLARGRLEEFIGVYRGMVVFDPATDLFADLVQSWMKELPGTFRVVHDRSKPLRRSEAFLRALMTPVVPRAIGYAARKAELPLRISSLAFEDSAAHPQLQVADLIAGASIDCLLAWSGRRPSSPYHEALRDSRLQKLFAGGMLPSSDVGGGPSPEPGEQSIVDGQAGFLDEIGYFERGRGS
jgi:hypothetical protein